MLRVLIWRSCQLSRFQCLTPLNARKLTYAAKVDIELLNKQRLLCRQFHRSSIRHSTTSIGALALIFYRPVAKVLAIIVGRMMRKSWQSVPLRERARRIRQWLYTNRLVASLVMGTVASSWVVFYITHLEKVPLTNRRRFVPLTPYQYRKISEAEEEMISASLEDSVINPTDELSTTCYRFLGQVVGKVLTANAHLIPGISDRKWRIILVKDNSPNAFAVPSGSIYVYTGLFNLVTNEHEMAMVLAHELSHVILGHGLENLTRATLLDVFLTILMASLWWIMPGDGIAVVASWFCHRVADLLFKLPFSRNLEREADAVGLDLLSRACFDPRLAAVIWRKMEVMEEILEDYEMAESTESSKSDVSTKVMSNFLSSVSSFQLPVVDQKLQIMISTLGTASKASDTDTGKSPVVSGGSTADAKHITKEDRKTSIDSDFFSTHPRPAERYGNICEDIRCGITAKAAKEGRCYNAELTKSLPADYDSPRKLRSDILEIFGSSLVAKEAPAGIAPPVK